MTDAQTGSTNNQEYAVPIIEIDAYAPKQRWPIRWGMLALQNRNSVL